MYGLPNSKSLLNNLMYASSPSFTTESNQALPAALYSLTYLVRAGGSSSSGFLVAGWVGSSVGAWVGSLVGSLLGPGCGSAGVGSVCGLVGLGSSGVSSGGASAPSVACASCLPLDLLAPNLPSFGCFSASSSPNGRSSSVSTSRASLYYSSGPALPLPMPVNVAAIMPTGQWDALPRGVCLVLPIYSNKLIKMC